MSRYRIPVDRPPISFLIVGSGFKDSKGFDAGAHDIDLSIESSSASLKAEIGPTQLSEDGLSVSAQVTLTAESPTVDFAVVTYKATNRDTGNVVAADSDEFVIGPGEASIGTLASPVPLIAEDEPAAPATPAEPESEPESEPTDTEAPPIPPTPPGDIPGPG